MKQIRLNRLLIASLFTLVSGATQAAFVGWGTSSSSTVATNCPSSSLCSTQNNGDFIRDSETNNQGSNASSEVDHPAGLTSGNATLDGNNFTPLLTAYGLSRSIPNTFPDNSGAFSTAIGVQGYTYTGPAQDLNLDLILTAILDETGASDSLARAEGRVVVFTGQDVGSVPFFTDRGTFLFEQLPGSGLQVDFSQALLSVNIDSGRALVRDFETIVIPNVVTGQDFLVWASLNASAYREGESDARNTLSLNFLNEDRTELTSGLSAISELAPSVIPVPGAVWLFLSGIGLVAGLSRRRKTS